MIKVSDVKREPLSLTSGRKVSAYFISRLGKPDLY